MNRLEPPDSMYLEAAQGWLELGDYPAANEELEKIAPPLRAHPDNLLRVVDRFPISATMRYNLACYECQLGRLEQAQQWLEKAFELGDAKAIKLAALEDPDLKPLWDSMSGTMGK